MAIETKEIIEYLGFNPEEVKELSDLKAKFEPEFIRASAITEDNEVVKPLINKVYGVLETEVRQLAKKNDLDIENDLPDFKTAKKINEKFALVLGKIAEKKDAKIVELTSAAGKGNDEKVNELTAALEKEKAKRKDIDSLLKNVSKEYDEFKLNSTNQLKSVKLDTLKNNARSSVKFIDGLTELQEAGYSAIINKKYKFDLDESGSKLVVTDAEGKAIPNPKVTGTFKSAEEVLIEEAVKQNLYKLNGDGGNKKQEVKKVITSGDDKPLRKVAQRMNL